MSGLPQISGVGTLTADPEIKMLPSGVARVTVNIAFNERKYNKQTGQYEDGDTTFLRGTVWREYGEHVAESLRKRDKVFVLGELRQRDYEKDGQRRSAFELDIKEIGPTLRFASMPGRDVALLDSSAGREPALTGATWGSDNSPQEPVW